MRFFFLLAFLLLPEICFAKTYVIDGDSLYINGVEIRLYGIDAPERRQAFNKAAARFLKSYIKGKKLTYTHIAKDQYKRTLALVYANNVNLQAELIKNGFAWVYPRYCKKAICNDWKKLQEQAKANKKGLWQDKNAISPWQWKHSGSSSTPSR